MKHCTHVVTRNVPPYRVRPCGLPAVAVTPEGSPCGAGVFLCRLHQLRHDKVAKHYNEPASVSLK